MIPKTAINEIIVLGFTSCNYFNNRISRTPITVYYLVYRYPFSGQRTFQRLKQVLIRIYAVRLRTEK